MRTCKKQFFNILSWFVVLSLLYSVFPVPGAKAEQGDEGQSVVLQIVQHLKNKRVDLGDEDLRGVADTICRESRYYNVDYRLVLALIEVESNFRPDVISRDGARGLMQLKPETARVIAREADLSYSGSSDLVDPRKNIQIGVYLLSKLIDDFKSIRKALYAYNVGPKLAKRKIARLNGKKDLHNRFTRRVMLAFQNNASTFPAL